ncbi:MAG TPA: ATP-binding domain-containing protein [Candidatus Limnocylindrales bacterium]
MGDLGDRAERIAEERIRAALPPDTRCYANVRFVARTRPTGPAHDGEADLVIVHPEHGLLVIEVKSGEPSRDARNRWFIGGHQLTRSPFEQAEDAKHDLVGAIGELLGVIGGDRPRAGHAVAFPDADLASLPPGHVLLGPDAATEIILDAAALADTASTRNALERAWEWWTGDGTRGRPLTQAQAERIHEYLAPTVALRRLVRRDVEDGRDRLIDASRAQKIVLNQNRSKRRLEIVGPAGSGKSLVAVERARRLAREGFRTLFVCFNQPLATAVGREIDEDAEPVERRPVVTTFHRLCERLGTQAGVLPAKPAGALPRDWWDNTLPAALDAAIDALPGERFHAVVIDEGQDFEPAWLTSLGFLLHDPAGGVLWVFHDPGQALFRDDRVAELGLDRLELFEDYRSPAPVAELAARFYHGPTEPYAMTEQGRRPVVVAAEPGRDTVEAVRKQLHRLLEVEEIRPWHVAVLSGVSATRSEVWKKRRFGNVELWNGAIDDAGASLGLPAEEIPDPPPDAGIVLFETIRRFKGLERPVVILCELPEEGQRLDQLLYTAFTRATAHLVVIAPPTLATRLDRGGGDRSGVDRGGPAGA